MEPYTILLPVVSIISLWQYFYHDDQHQSTSQSEQTDPVPTWYCSKAHYLTNVTFIAQSVPCLSLKKSEIIQEPPPGLCSKVDYISNTTITASSVSCFHLDKQNRPVEKFQQTSYKNELYETFPRFLYPFCSKPYINNGSLIAASSIPCSELSSLILNTIVTQPSSGDEPNDYEFQLNFLSSWMLCFIAAITVFLTLTKRNNDYTVSPDWDQIENERRQKLEEALKYQEEMQERRRIRREEHAAETEQKAHDKILTLISSLTRPLLVETRNFNEWMQTPD